MTIVSNFSRHGLARSIIVSRCFSTSRISWNVASDTKAKQQQRDAKAKLKREQVKKMKNKQPPELHPLYMEISKALRYLRAAEVGQPSKKSTISVLLTVIPERGSKPLNGTIFFPKPVKDSKVLVFSQSEEALDSAKQVGASLVGGEELIEDVKQGNVKLDTFTHCFATPDILSSLRVIARNLGQRGLMPTSKKGTVAEDISALIKENLGSLVFKQKGQHLSFPVGRCDFSDKEIIENLTAASTAIYGLQPPGTKKPNLIGKAFLSSTIGPSILINFKN